MIAIPVLFSCGIGIVLLQGYAADQGVPNTEEIFQTSPLDLVSSYTDDGPLAAPASEKMQEEFDIIRLCTDLPYSYNEILKKYFELPKNASDTEEVQKYMESLKRESEKLMKYVDLYTTEVENTDPNAQSVRQEMVTGMTNLVTSLEQLNSTLTSTSNSQMDSAEKVTFVQNNIKPAIMGFEEACLTQTKDILQNVLADLKHINSSD